MYSLSKEKKDRKNDNSSRIFIPVLAKQDQNKNTKISLTQNLGVGSNLGTSNEITQSFSFPLQTQVQSLFWDYNIPTLAPNQKGFALLVRKFSTSILNFVGEDFPQTINIVVKQGLTGYSNKTGSGTGCIVVLRLKRTSPINQVAFSSRDLIYESQNQTLWNLGMNRSLKFEIYLNGTQKVLYDLANPITTDFKIIHVVY